MKKKQWMHLFICLCFYSSVSSQTIIYVDSSATGLNNGQSWQNAYKSLDSALIHATNFSNADSIKIAKGTYKPSLIPGNLSTGNPRDVAFYISFDGVISGGYSSGGTVLNSQLYPTILSGDIGVKNDSLDNAYHVLVLQYSGTDLSGITITGGNADGTGSLQLAGGSIPRFNGGGFYCLNAYASLYNIIAENNHAFYGGAIYNDSSELDIFDVVLNSNNASRGGAMYNNSASISNLNNVVAYRNFADDAGGAILNDNASKYTINNCTFAENFINTNIGGAIYNTQNSTTSTLTNCLFTGNYAWDPSITGDYGSDIADSSNTVNASYCVFQTDFHPGKNNYVSLGSDVVNIDNPKGPDNIWMTKDDGLSIIVQSQAFKNGETGNTNFDITNAERYDSTFDIGAYEINACSQLAGRIIYVDSSATGTQTGSSWANAFTNLQTAINLGRFGCADTIKVAAGTYNPLSYLHGQTGSQSGYIFQLPSNVAILGGYPHGGSSTANPAINKTILTIRIGGVFNTGQVMFAGNVSNILLDGLCIQDGNQYGSSTDVFTVKGISYPLGQGGGILICNAGVEMRNCYIRNNYSAYNGGGVAAVNSIVKIEHCSFEGNSSPNEGGGLFVNNGGAGSVIDSTSFINNTGGYYGGAVGLYKTVIAINNSKFKANKTTVTGGNVVGGGAVFSENHTGLTINKCVFDSNTSFEGGALNFGDASSNTILNSFFVNNSASRDGGAIFDDGGSNKLYNNIFSTNKAVEKGGAISSGSNTNVYFSVFLRNDAGTEGGAVDGLPSSIGISNSIFRLNTVAGDTLATTAEYYQAGVTDCSFQFAPATSGSYRNITGIDPMFVNMNDILGPDSTLGTEDDGLRLKVQSPLINEGQWSYDTTVINTDITGAPRQLSTEPDMGPYEMDFCALSGFTNKTIYVDSSAVSGNRTGSDWANAFTDFETALRAFRSGCNIDTIKVAKGTYYTTAVPGYSPYHNVDPAAKTFNIPDSIVLLGGYSNGGGDRDYHHNETILSGRGVTHVVSVNNLTYTTIDGFSIMDGSAGNSHGGGVFANNSVIDIKNTIIKNNFENGAYLNNCTGKMMNCIISNNQSYFGGGGIYNSGSSVEYDNCIFYKNIAENAWGGGIFINYTNNAVPSFKSCTFYGNSSTWGGGIFSGAIPVVTNCLFWNNYSGNKSPDSTANDIYAGPMINSQKVSFSLFQYKPTANTGGVNCIYGTYPAFADSANAKGPDNTWGTADDGLALTNSSYAINNGSNDSIPANITTDITGAPRINSGVVDIGAYEYNCGFTNFTNRLVPLGFSDLVNNTFNTCGTWQFRTSVSDPTKYIIEIDPNGNDNFNPLGIKIDATNTQSQISTNGKGDTTALAYRMVSINAPGEYPVNGGMKIRIFYDKAEFNTLPGATHYWYKHIAHDKAIVLSDLSPDSLANSIKITPSSYGTINGISYVEFDSLTSFSTFGYLGVTHLSGALPLQFLSFTAQWKEADKSVLLNWMTSEELNVKSFVVERSSNGNIWYSQNTLEPSQIAGLNHSYNWTDTHPLTGLCYYRIKQVDYDGKSSFSIIRLIKSDNGISTFEILPNPATNIAYIKLANITPIVNYEVTDVAGRIINKGVQYNTSAFSISFTNQSAGIYYLTINNKTQKLVLSK